MNFEFASCEVLEGKHSDLPLSGGAQLNNYQGSRLWSKQLKYSAFTDRIFMVASFSKRKKVDINLTLTFTDKTEKIII